MLSVRCLGEGKMRCAKLLGIAMVLGVVGPALAQQSAAPAIRTADLIVKDSDDFAIPIPLRPQRTVRIVAPVSTTVEKVEVAVGDRVAVGGALARLSNRRETVQVEALHEKIRLLEGQSGGGYQAQLALIEAKEQLQLLKLTIESTIARAPFDGRVFDVLVSDGQFVRAGEPLLVVADTSSLVARAAGQSWRLQEG